MIETQGKIRIVHLITGLESHGAERTLAKLLTASDQTSFHHEVVSMSDVGPVGEQLIAAGVRVHALQMSRGVPSPAALFRLAKVLRRSKPRILHCWMYHANLLGILCSKLVTVPHIVWGIRSANDELAHYRRLTRWVIWLGARFSGFPSAIIVNSRKGERLHQNWRYETARMTFIPNAFELDVFKPDPAARRSVRAELHVGEDTILIGLMARFHPVKDHETFFRGARLLSSRVPGVHFVLSGDEVSPDNFALARMVRENQLDGQVHLLGPRSDVARLMAALDVACLTSKSEAFSNAVGEAMACAVPCVVTDVGDSASIVSDTGFVVPTRNPEALAEACWKLVMMEPRLREELGARARMRIESAFDLASMVCSYETLYRSLTSGLASQKTHPLAN